MRIPGKLKSHWSPLCRKAHPHVPQLHNTVEHVRQSRRNVAMLCIAGEVNYYKLQLGLSLMGLLWVSKMPPRVEYLANTDGSEWRSKEGRGREAGKNV